MQTTNFNELISRSIVFQDLQINILDIFLLKHESGGYVPFHHHAWYEFNYVETGSMLTSIQGQEIVTEAGESLLIPPGVFHNNTFPMDDSGLCIRFSLKKLLNEASGCFHDISSALSIPRVFSFKTDVSMFYVDHSIYSLQIAFLKWLFDMYEVLNLEKRIDSGVGESVSFRVTNYLQEHYSDKIKVSEIADELNLSYRSLARKFKEETGVSIMEKLTSIRIEKAKQLLLTTDDTMLTIANTVGYENEYYFSRAFTKYSTINPSTFRQTNRKGRRP